MFSLKQYNTLQVDAHCKYFKQINNESDYLGVISADERKNSKERLFLGGGSNILFSNDFQGYVIQSNIQGIKIVHQNEWSATIKVGSGVVRNDFVNWALDNGFCYIENLIDIPGTVGASAVQNIGAYGSQAQDFIHQVVCIDLDGNKTILSNDELEFGYRDSIFKHSKQDCFITNIYFKLEKLSENYFPNINYKDIQSFIIENKIEKLSPRILGNIVSDIRKSKLPDMKNIGTAGSFFKNPIVTNDVFLSMKTITPNLIGNTHGVAIKLSAGQLIELSGLKNIMDGNTGTYEKHALVVINNGGTGQEVLNFTKKIQKTVSDKFGVMLEPEVIIL